MPRRSIIFLGTAASAPNKYRFTQSIVICGAKECILLDAGEGVQVRLLSAGIDHRHVNLVAISHLHGDHIHGLPPLVETLEMKISTQKMPSRYLLKIVAPATYCRLLHMLFDITKASENNKNLDILCMDAGNLCSTNIYVETPSKEIRVLPIRVYHGPLEAYGYYVDLSVSEKNIGIFYSGDGLCKDNCVEKLKTLKPAIVIHEATFLDYDGDAAKARESGHATLMDAAKLALEVGARVLILTHISARYDRNAQRDFLSRSRRIFEGDIFIAEDLTKIPLDLLSV